MRNFGLAMLAMSVFFLASSTVDAQRRSSVVEIQVPNVGSGSGFFVTRNLIMTNAHVVAKSVDGKVVVKFGSVRVWGLAISICEYADLALVYIKGRGPKPFRFCNKVEVDEKIEAWVYQHGKVHKKPGLMKAHWVDSFTASMRAIKGNSGGPTVQGWGRGRCVAGVVRGRIIGTGESVHVEGYMAENYLIEFFESIGKRHE